MQCRRWYFLKHSILILTGQCPKVGNAFHRIPSKPFLKDLEKPRYFSFGLLVPPQGSNVVTESPSCLTASESAVLSSKDLSIESAWKRVKLLPKLNLCSDALMPKQMGKADALVGCMWVTVWVCFAVAGGRTPPPLPHLMSQLPAPNPHRPVPINNTFSSSEVWLVVGCCA